MPDITEQDIEQYIRFPESLSEQKHTAVEQAIESTEEYQQLASFFKEFDSIFEQCNTTGEYTISLVPYNPETTASHPNRLLLAAQSKQETGMLRTVETLASDEDETLVKILKNKEIDKYQIHLISNRVTEEPCILSLRDVGTDFIINQNGKLTFTPNFDIASYQWEQAHFALHIPITKFSCPIQQITNENKQYTNNNISLELSMQDQQVEGQISSTESKKTDITRVLTATNESGLHLEHVNNGSFRIAVEHGENLSIWLFE